MTQIDRSTDFGTLFSAVVALTSPIQAVLERPVYDGLPRWTLRPPGRRWITRTAHRLLAWQERASQRRQLLRLDEHMLRDIALSRADAEAEARKPFWRA